MAGQYRVECRDFWTGERLLWLGGATSAGARNGFLALRLVMQVNAPGLLTLTVPGDLPDRQLLTDLTQIVVWRRDVARGVDWYRAFVGLLRDDLLEDDGQPLLTLTCPGLLHLLDRYHVLWPAGVANRTVWTNAKAETIATQLVQYNATASATAAAGRDRDAASTGITVATDQLRGATLPSWTASRSRTALEELQRLAPLAGGAFDLEYTSATTRTFRFYPGQRGQDKTTTHIFAKARGTMGGIRFAQVRSAARTVAVVGGQGEGTARQIVTRTSSAYSPTNAVETFVDARNEATTAGMEAAGDARLAEESVRTQFRFRAVQTASMAYGPHADGYMLGDRVSAIRPDGVRVSATIDRVQITWEPSGQETIGVEVEA